MTLHKITEIFSPIALAFEQFDDPIFRNVLATSVAAAASCFALLYFAAATAFHHWATVHSEWLGWLTGVAGAMAAALLAFWLFLPLATGIGMLFVDRIAAAVERRFYPTMPNVKGASVWDQVWDGMVVTLKVFGLSLLATILALLIPGIGFVLGWVVAAYAIGRGLFVAVAMRRMPRFAAESLYRHQRTIILFHGAILALFGYIPLLNLLIPITGTAAMVHILDMALSDTHAPSNYSIT